MIYNAGSNYPSSGGKFSGITLSSTGTITLRAPTSGPDAGILIFQSHENTLALSLSGNALSGMNGTIYAPSALLSLNGSAQLQQGLVVGTLSVSGPIALTQIAAGSDGTGDTSGIANTLLAGDLSVYINDPSGLFTADELARIQDAINAWDAILAPYNVTITEVSDPTLANVVIDTSTTSAYGGMSNGVLGCFNAPNSEITLLQGWNWYAGSDPSQIGAGQYDFETTVLHELGHALGLGGSTDSSSPMYETLASGVALRTVTTQDLNIPDPPAGADPQMAAGFRPVASVGLSAPSAAVAPAMVPRLAAVMPLPSSSSGQWSEVRDQWPTAGVPANWQSGLVTTLVVQGLDDDHGRELSLTGPEAVRVLDSALADLVTDADQSQGEDVDGTSGVRVLPGAGDVEDGTAPQQIRFHWINPTEFSRPLGLPPRVQPIEPDFIGMDSISDGLTDELAAAALGLAGRLAVPADSIAGPETPREPHDVLAKLAATLIVAGSWAHRGRFRSVTSRQAGRPRYRNDPE
jgi:hypothetical protein